MKKPQAFKPKQAFENLYNNIGSNLHPPDNNNGLEGWTVKLAYDKSMPDMGSPIYIDLEHQVIHLRRRGLNYSTAAECAMTLLLYQSQLDYKLFSNAGISQGALEQMCKLYAMAFANKEHIAGYAFNSTDHDAIFGTAYYDLMCRVYENNFDKITDEFSRIIKGDISFFKSHQREEFTDYFQKALDTANG